MARWLTRGLGVVLFVVVEVLLASRQLRPVRAVVPDRRLWRQRQIDEQRLQQQLQELQQQLDEAARRSEPQPQPVEPLARPQPIG